MTAVTNVMTVMSNKMTEAVSNKPVTNFSRIATAATAISQRARLAILAMIRRRKVMLAISARTAMMAIPTAKRLLTHLVSVASPIVQIATTKRTNATTAPGLELQLMIKLNVNALMDFNIFRILTRVV